MKKQILVMAAAIMSLGAAAQEVTTTTVTTTTTTTTTTEEVKHRSRVVDNPDNHAYWGVRAALDVSDPTPATINNVMVNPFTTGVGFSAGAIYHLPIVANFYFQPGAYLFYDVYGLKEVDKMKSSIRKFGFHMPLDLGYHFDFAKVRLHVMVGPGISVGFVGKECVTFTGGGWSGHKYYDLYSEEDIPRFDISLCGGLGVDWRNWYFGVESREGLLNMSGTSDFSFQERETRITVGYNF